MILAQRIDRQGGEKSLKDSNSKSAIDFTLTDRVIVLNSVKFIVHTNHIDDIEFSTILGPARSEMREVIFNWNLNSLAELNDDLLAGVNNCMNTLCNGMRVKDDEVFDFTGFHKSEIRKTFDTFKQKYYPNGPYPEDPDDAENEFFNDLK